MSEWKETEIGKIPSDWDLGLFNNDLRVQGRIGWKGYKTSDLVEVGPYVIGGTEIKSSIFLDLSHAQHLRMEKYLESPEIMLKNGDVLLVTRGNLGEVGFFWKDYGESTINPSVIILSSFNGNPKYLFYYLISKQGNANVLSLAGGSSVPAIYQADIKKLVYPKPNKVEQDRIVDVMFSIDLKIDLLHRQNKTLEQLAETLFRQWFVEEADESWAKGKLEDIATFSNGKSRPSEFENGEIPIYGGNGILGYTNKSNYQGFSIIIGRVGAYCGSLYIENVPIWLSDNALLTRSKNSKSPFFLFYLLKSMDLNSLAEGSSHPLLTQTLLKSIDIEIPSADKILQFEFYVNEFWNKRCVNQNQIRTLSQLRNTLLPKLISGEVRVKN